MGAVSGHLEVAGGQEAIGMDHDRSCPGPGSIWRWAGRGEQQNVERVAGAILQHGAGHAINGVQVMSLQTLNNDASSMQVSDSQASYLPDNGTRLPSQALNAYTNIDIVANQQSPY